MTSNPSNREPRQDDREVFSNLEQSVNNELASGHSAGGMDREIISDFSQLILELVKENNRNQETTLKAALSSNSSASKGKGDKGLKFPLPSWAIGVLLITVALVFLACFIFCIIAAYNPGSLFPKEIQADAAKVLLNAPLAIFTGLMGWFGKSLLSSKE
jgi:hypothetical protein